MLRQRQKLNMGETHLLDILGELRSNLTVTQPSVVVFGNATPGSEMDFIDCNRRMYRISLCARRHPVLVMPFVIEIPNDRCGSRRRLGMKRKRVRLIYLIAVVTRYDMVLVRIAMPNGGNKSFPNSRLAAGIQLQARLIPVVE